MERLDPIKALPATALRSAALVATLLLTACGGRPSVEEYSAYQVALRSMGDLRTERAPADAPYTSEDLVRNFERIALYHETDASRPGAEDNRETNPLMRWVGPLNYRLFGGGVTDDDHAEVRRLMGRVAELTGLEVTEASSELNFLVLVTTPEERDDYALDLRHLNPALAETFEFWRHTPEVICVANNLFSPDDANAIVAGLVTIGSETQGLLRTACLHEEIVQALGLANDHPAVRPSIFNDDSEFALLTEHDEKLLRILYDRRLSPGMEAAEAMPVVRRIVAELQTGLMAASLAPGFGALPAATDVSGARSSASTGGSP